LFESGQAADGHLDWEGDEPLDLLWGQGRGNGIDLNLDRRRVRKGVDCQVAKRVKSACRGEQDGGDDDHAITEGPVNDGVEHAVLLVSSDQIAQQLGLQGVAADGHNLFASGHAVENLPEAAAAYAELHEPSLKAPIVEPDEDEMALVFALHRLVRHGERVGD